MARLTKWLFSFTALIVVLLNSHYSFANSSSLIIQKALNQKLDQSPTWHALIHYHQNHFFVTDPAFLLSAKKPSAKQELIETLKLFLTGQAEKNALCRFPARYLWLSNQLQLKKIALQQADCPSYLEYKTLAPSENIELIFASEDLTSPSSMMGHAFLKLSGKNPQGKTVEHAVSYFTVIDPLNPVSLVYKSLFEGMPGKLALLPYRTHIERYQNQENRNIWQYQLNLSSQQKQLIHAHIWELKDKQSLYYFTRYNCATFTHFLLALVEPRILNQPHLWVTPTDVIKDADHYHLIHQSELSPSPKWFIHMLLSELQNPQQVKSIQQSILNGQQPHFAHSKQDLLETKLWQVYNDYAFTNKKIDQPTYQINSKQIPNPSQISHIDISNYKSPIKTPNDSQLSIGIIDKRATKWLGLRFLPSAHLIYDDNRQYFNENQLTMADTQLNVNLEKNELELDHFTFYGIEILNPWNRLTRGLSGKWKLSIEDQYDNLIKPHKVLNLEGALGLTFRVVKDMDFFTLIGGGLAGNFSQQYGYLYPETGMVIREIWNMKTVLKAQAFYHHLGEKDIQLKTSWHQSLYAHRQFSIQFGVTHYQNMHQSGIQTTEWQFNLVGYL